MTTESITNQFSEIRDGMHIDWNVPIQMDDGIVLRGDVYRPLEDGRFPVIMTYGPYGKNLPFQKGYAQQWEALARDHPEAVAGSTNQHQAWETVDPEKWVPDGYVVIRVDSRGAGASPGVLDVHSPRETQDLYACIEWAASQPWNNGKVGLCGISYYAMNQWRVAALRPPHLAAMIPWEGAGDRYREATYHGGIMSEFGTRWFRQRVAPMQHRESTRAANPGRRLLDDEWYRARSADWSQVNVPFLSAANWGGQGLHLRGNMEAFMLAASQHKWLEVHGLEHWTHFYTPYGVDLQKRFLGYLLKGEHNGWEKQPRVQLQIRHVDGSFTERHEHEWPLARTQWTPYYLDPNDRRLSTEPVAVDGTITYAALGEGVTFSTPALEKETEITGPIAAKLFLSSSTRDADLFLVVRVFAPSGDEVTFPGALAPNAPVAQGWLRASHRKLDSARALPFRPYHLHDEIQPLIPGEVYELDVEIWPTCVVIPSGYRIALSVRGKDYEYEGTTRAPIVDPAVRLWRGCGPFTHNEARDRPTDVFGGTVSLHAGGQRRAHLLLPIIPARD